MNLPIALALTLVAGCVVDDTTLESETTSALSKDPIDTDPPPAPAPPPPEGSHVVRISSSDLTGALSLFLAGPLVTVDTTQTSPPRSGPLETVCSFPNQEAREAATAECYASFSGAGLYACLQEVNTDWPNISECHSQAQIMYSYIDFVPTAEAMGATDVLFNTAPIVKDTWAGVYTFNINYVRSNLSGSISAGFGPNKTASVWLPLTSNAPTLRCSGGWGCPDIEMTNMRLLARFTDIRPGAAYSCAAGGTAPNCTGGAANIVSASLMHSTARPTLYFDRDVNYVPDVIVDALVDVDAAIRDAAEGKLYGALTTTAGHGAVAKALTGIALNRVRQTTHPTIRGFSRIKNTWYTTGELVIEYDWY